MSHISERILINAPVEKVRDLALDPAKWSIWYSGLGEAEEIEGDGGTEVIAGIEYTVPGKALGKIADRLVVERVQQRAAHETMERLKILAES